jgi:adenylate cyclase class 2
MAFPLEREVKLRFASAADARDAVLATGATPLRPRRLQSDTLLDTDDGTLTGDRCALRIRMDAGQAILTFKGPPQPSVMKLREELQTEVADGPLLLTVLGRLGFRPWFRSQKYREEFTLGEVIIAIDETPVGTFVELEGTEDGIGLAAAALECGPQDYVVESYRSLFVKHCAQHNVAPGDMLFPGAD